MIGGGGKPVSQGPPVRLALRTFKNQSFEPNLEFKYTRYVRQALQSVGSADFTTEEKSADFILEGTILSVTLPSLTFTRTQTQESRVMVRVAVAVVDRETKKPRWAYTTNSTAEFYVGATSTSDSETGLQFNRVLQDRAVEQAGRLVAEDIADRFLSARDQGKFDRVRKQPPPGPNESKPETVEPDVPTPHPDQTVPLSPFMP